ncbi:PTS sugar transporter subunit IIA [Treponema sp.]|uniref:PTS sugar transporter subunit IIA n=1 Tax=Treponema sp. TaxID=166 RepID=UPI003F047CCA
MENVNMKALFERGEFLESVPGNSYQEIYKYICGHICMPTGVEAAELEKFLVDREQILSTAIGNGIAIPHPRCPIVKNSSESKIVVVYLREPVDMKAPDVRKVFAMFVLLSDSSLFHVKVLSNLASLFKNETFQKRIKTLPSKAEFLDMIEGIFPELSV